MTRAPATFERPLDAAGSRSPRARLLDAVVTLLLLAGGLVEALGVPEPPAGDELVKQVVVIAAAVLPLLLHRRFPLLTLVTIAAVVMGASLTDFSPGSAGNLALLFATFNAVAVVPPRVGWASLALALAAVTAATRPWETPPTLWLYAYLLFIAVFAAGRAQSNRQELARALEARLVDMQVQRERLRRLALERARAGLARDLQEVVVRRLGEMRAQAKEALRRLSSGGDAAPWLEATEAAGRTALAELRRLLVLLRESDGELEGPPPRDYAGLIRPRSRLNGLLVDLLLVGGLAVAALVEFGPEHKQIAGLEPPANAFGTPAQAWAIALVLPLLLRRRAPLLTAVAMALMAFMQNYFGYFTPISNIAALQIAVFSVGASRPGRPHAWVVAVLAAIGLFAPQPLTVSYFGSLSVFALSLLGAAYLGMIVGERARLNDELDQSLVTLEEEHQTELALALEQERLRAAREMHDLGAHGLTLMVIQAGAARTVAAEDPAAAREALQSADEAGERTLGELDRLLALLADDDAGQPARLEDLEALARHARATGLEVELEVEGDERPAVGSSLELAAYRILEECLTNVRKHAAGAKAHVLLRFGADALAVRVENDSASGAGDLAAVGAGHGLLGMQERATLFGGRIDAGPSPGGGFVVEAVIPRDRAPA